MNIFRILGRLATAGLLGSLLFGFSEGLGWRSATAQTLFIRLAVGFTPNPTVLEGTGGGDRPAAEVVNATNSLTGPCLGYISETPHEEVTLDSNFANLEMRVESELDTTLIVSGPDGIWCNDDSGGKNPAIAGGWAPGIYQVWIGAYRAEQVPEYVLYISDRS
ncbi:MAG: hypothetical protein AAF609_02370 [Cyanobacteria bacterium P01_C01_bin.120]